ncbi:MAG: ComF family protein [Clostridia bacterium]|nr:ComF family protein [Clostridia bacterium]
MNKTVKLINKLLFPPVCAGCGEKLSPVGHSQAYGKACFCNGCFEKWLMAKAELCPKCAGTADKCTCLPRFFKELQPNLPALCYYHSEDTSVSDRVILTMKRVNDSELFEFIGLELIPRLICTLDEMGIAGEDCVFTWVPRKTASIAQSGLDQGQKLCFQVAAGFGKQPDRLFVRMGGKEQKHLNPEEREKNAKQAIALNLTLKDIPTRRGVGELKELIDGKSIVIVDDVITTGATLKNAVTLLKSAGAENVIVCCVARTAPSRRKKTEKNR